MLYSYFLRRTKPYYEYFTRCYQTTYRQSSSSSTTRTAVPHCRSRRDVIVALSYTCNLSTQYIRTYRYNYYPYTDVYRAEYIIPSFLRHHLSLTVTVIVLFSFFQSVIDFGSTNLAFEMYQETQIKHSPIVYFLHMYYVGTYLLQEKV